MRFDLPRSPFHPREVRPGDVFDVGTPAHPDVLTVRVILPVEHSDGRWTLYASPVRP